MKLNRFNDEEKEFITYFDKLQDYYYNYANIDSTLKREEIILFDKFKIIPYKTHFLNKFKIYLEKNSNFSLYSIDWDNFFINFIQHNKTNMGLELFNLINEDYKTLKNNKIAYEIYKNTNNIYLKNNINIFERINLDTYTKNIFNNFENNPIMKKEFLKLAVIKFINNFDYIKCSNIDEETRLNKLMHMSSYLSDTLTNDYSTTINNNKIRDDGFKDIYINYESLINAIEITYLLLQTKNNKNHLKDTFKLNIYTCMLKSLFSLMSAPILNDYKTLYKDTLDDFYLNGFDCEIANTIISNLLPKEKI